jgi:hypothetical protein
MSIITINTRIDQHLDVDVHLNDIIDYLTDRPTTEKINFCAGIINGLSLDLKQLSPEHLNLFKNWLILRTGEVEAINKWA